MSNAATSADQWAPMNMGSMQMDTPLEAVQSDVPMQHTTAAFFHVAFKAAAVFFYLFSTMFITSNFILVFVVCVLCNAFDFWTVKNVSGRLMVGLRWWNEVREDGSNVWVFETAPEGTKVHPTDSVVFWGALYSTPLVWMIFAFSALTSPQWLLVVISALVLSSANVVGYWRCQKDAKNQIRNMMMKKVATMI